MPWWTLPRVRRIGWLLLFALTFWGMWASVWALSLLGWRVGGAWIWIPMLLPLALAFLFGVRLRSWWWTLDAPAAIVLVFVAYLGWYVLTRSQPGPPGEGQGLGLLILFGVPYAGVAALAAEAGASQALAKAELAGRIARLPPEERARAWRRERRRDYVVYAIGVALALIAVARAIF